MSKVLVFGANGYIGRHICKVLKEKNCHFLPIGHSKNSIDGYSNYVSLDISVKSDFDKISLDVDMIFMFAAVTGTQTDDESVKRFKSVNEEGLTNLLDSIVEQKSNAKVIFPSTRLVYKGVKGRFLTENAEKETKTPYALSKLNGEKLLADYNVSNGLNYTIFRICVPYGNSFDENYSYGTIGFFLSKAKNGEDINIYGDGELKRTFTHIEDIVEVIVNTSYNPISDGKTYNVGGNDSISLKKIASLIAKKYSVGLNYIKFPKEVLLIESGDTMFNDDKIKKELDVNYRYSISDFL